MKIKDLHFTCHVVHVCTSVTQNIHVQYILYHKLTPPPFHKKTPKITKQRNKFIFALTFDICLTSSDVFLLGPRVKGTTLSTWDVDTETDSNCSVLGIGMRSDTLDS